MPHTAYPSSPQEDHGTREPLVATTQHLCAHLRRGPLSRVDEALLIELIATIPACRDAALAVLTGHHPTDDPTWLTHGPNDADELELALSLIDGLLSHCDASSGSQLAAMRAWVLWAGHRPAEALRTLATHSPTPFGNLFQRAIAITPLPILTRKAES